MDKSNNNLELTTLIGKDGLSEQPWWVEQWMELINSYRYKKRLERAWAYARAGNVTSIQFEGRRVHARVQGTENKPYKIKLWLDVLNDEDWEYVLESLIQKASWSAQLLTGHMPEDIERAFAASGKRLFPFKLQEVRSECTCPDGANPCKHISAVYFLMGECFREDPFILFQLRGRSKSKLLQDLTTLRTKILREGKNNNIKIDKSNLIEKDNTYSQSITEKAEKWWTYKLDLHPDLVVITSNSEAQSGILSAGDLPLAADPQFPESRGLFLNNLKEQSRLIAEKAMIKAMQKTNK